MITSESLHSTTESSETPKETVSEATDLAIGGLARIISEQGKQEGPENQHEQQQSQGKQQEDQHEQQSQGKQQEDQNEGPRGKERTDLNEQNLTLQEITLPKEFLKRYPFLRELPSTVAVMGGVARSIAREIITGEREPIRDIDLVNITNQKGESEVDYYTLDALSRKFMPDDYTFGHGIKDSSLEDYFMTRDFTINQSLIMNGKLIVSDLAYNDFQENIIRPTYFEHPFSGDDISGRLFLKALMMKSVLSQISSSVPLLEDFKKPKFIGNFNVALFLNKAMSRGARTAHKFTQDLAEWNIVSEYYADRPVALAKSLLGSVSSFEFRPSTDERFLDVRECSDMAGFFVPPSMLRYHASSPVIRRAISEYEDGRGNLMGNGEERDTGHYSQAEYDDINNRTTPDYHYDYFVDYNNKLASGYDGDYDDDYDSDYDDGYDDYDDDDYNDDYDDENSDD